VGPFIMGKIDFSQHDLCFRSWSCYLCQTHLFNSKLRVQLHDGAANWWSSSSRVGLAEPEPCQTRPICSLFLVETILFKEQKCCQSIIILTETIRLTWYILV
jgi:hypothetical protein